MKLHEAFSPDESKKIYDNFLAIVNDPKRRNRLVSKYGKNAENVAYGTAVNQVKKQAANNIEEPQPQETMENNRLKEMVIDALTEKKKSTAFTPEYDDKFTDKRKNLPDGLQKSILKKQGKLEEDLDLGHEDNEPHMIKAELYKIGKYAMELYKMVDQFEGPQEVDFPGWWQSKITTAKNMISSAKHYLEFELKEPEIDAMVGVASEEGAVGEEMTPEKSRKKGMPFKDVTEEAIDEMSKKQIKKRGEIFDALVDKGMSKKKAGPIATSTAMKEAKAKIKEAILAKLKNK
jgi:hypothetical protein